jgi:hypothetical protein
MKTTFLIIFHLLLLNNILVNQSKAQNWTWSKSEDDPFEQHITNVSLGYTLSKERVAVDQYGNTITYALIRTYSIINSQQDTTRVRINKIDRYGNLIWQRFIVGKAFYDMEIDRFGNTYAALSNFDLFNGQPTTAITTDRCLIKVDANGKLIWKKPLGRLDYDGNPFGYFTLAINSSNDNIYAIAQPILTTFSFCDSTYSVPVYYNRFMLFRIDTDGKIIYSREIKGVETQTTQIPNLSVSNNDMLLFNYDCAYGQNSVVLGDTIFHNTELKGFVAWVNGLNGSVIKIKDYKQLNGANWVMKIGSGQQMKNGESMFCITISRFSTTINSLTFEFADTTITALLQQEVSNPFSVVLNPNGKLKYFKTLGPGNLNVTTVTNDGVNYYLGGSKSVSVDSLSFFKPYIHKIGTDGQLLWTIAPRSVGNTSQVNDLSWRNEILTSVTSVHVSAFPVFGNDTIPIPYNSDTYSVVSKIGGLFNLIKGQVYYDLNKNGIRDLIEPGLSNVIITDSAKNIYQTTGYDGKYYIVTDTGTYNLKIPVKPSYSNWMPVVHLVNFGNTYGQTAIQKNFRLSFDTIIRDMSVYSTLNGTFRPGFETQIVVQYKNNGNQLQSGKYSIKLHPSLEFLGSDSTTAYTSADSLSWNYVNVYPFESRRNRIRVRAKASSQIGSIIKNISYIYPVDIDSIPLNNIDTFVDYVRGSFDPNDKLSNPINEISFESTLLGRQYIDYTVRFQNTGNDTAFNVRIIDSISTKLDLNNFELLASSHPVQIDLLHNRVFEFHFPNILLPDSNRNETLSHGFIRFRIKVNRMLLITDTVKNEAGIYFDYNNPVITNKTKNYFIPASPTVTRNILNSQKSMRLFPNPAKDIVNYELLNVQLGKYSLRIYDLKGNLLYFSNLSQNGSEIQGQLSTSFLRGGIYIFEVSNEKSVITKKLVKL